MISGPLYNLAAADTEPADLFPKRHEVVDRIVRSRRFDVLIVGGGVHGAAFARLAAFNGLKTCLLERDDYASGTSSRSSKMAHGGLRYLEMLDFRQVMEGIRAREELFDAAPHLVHPSRFLIPIPRERGWFRLKMALGLKLYDLLVKKRDRRHYWLPAEDLPEHLFGRATESLAGCFSYTDGILNDSRVVIETIIAARQEGALCLNHASVDHIGQRESGDVEVGWTDSLTGKKHQTLAGIVVNCAGPWVPFLGRLKPSETIPRVKYSQGVHLLFDKEWKGPSLFLPLPAKGQYYFVWPHFSGTMVGTTEREVSALERDPIPTKDEIDELLGRLERDLPHAGLNRSSLHYAFAGVRTLPLRGRDAASSRLSRRHIWSYSNGVLSLVGGKFTTHAWTVQEGLGKVYALAGLGKKLHGISNRRLPGGGMPDEIESFRRKSSDLGVPPDLIERTIGRLGSRVRYFVDDSYFRPIGGAILAGDVELAISMEQAETLEDLVRRRLDLEYMPGNGLEVLDEVASMLSARRPGADVDEQLSAYRDRLDKLWRIMKER